MIKSQAVKQVTAQRNTKGKNEKKKNKRKEQIVRMELGQPGILSNVKIKIQFLHKMIKMKGVGEICLRPRTTKIGSHIK